MKEGLVVLSPFTNMPDDVAKMAAETAEKIKSGELHPFTGPITRQDGTVVGEAGKPLPDTDLLSMNWYVKGVDDKLPQ
jgi:simple sugar transport system substrate-binding protein